jgi:heme-degrading monooxygenase HmoA
MRLRATNEENLVRRQTYRTLPVEEKPNTGGKTMHVLIVNFNLKDIGEEEYRGIAESFAPAFAGLPGLVSKTWLVDAETNTYGGVYVWRSREASEDYKETDIYKGMEGNPQFENFAVREFAVLEGPTRTTGGLAEVSA